MSQGRPCDITVPKIESVTLIHSFLKKNVHASHVFSIDFLAQSVD